MDVHVYGGDSETLNGEPMSFQFYSELADIDEIRFVNATNATEKFFSFCASLQRRCLHLMFVHNLEFDLPEFLWSRKELLVSNSSGEFDFTYRDWRVRGVYGKPTFCRLTNERRKLSIILLDSYLWFQTSLARAGEIVCPDLPKLTSPKGLGTVKFTSKDTKFCEYAMRDSVVAYHLGCAIQLMHREFDIPPAVSLADMAAKIFKRHFLPYTIPQPPADVIASALKSYHGGKNNIIADAAPRWHLGVTALDFSSAYPKAMADLPAFSNAKLYKRLKSSKKAPREVNPFGVYCVSGTLAECEWPVLFSHGFEPLSGKILNVHVQGFELREAIASGEFKCSRISGTYYDAERDNVNPALARFVAHFYALKQSEKDPVKRYMYKIVLNSLYGKLIQTRKNSCVIYTNVDANETVEATEMIAGGMFHPFIASAITAHTREAIHKAEHAHKAIHTATDGIYTYLSKPKRIDGVPASGLGSLQIEGRGDLCLLRNKCYVLYSPKGDTPSKHFKGKRIKKYALHGFQGKIYDLERLISTGARSYSVDKPNRLRDSIKRGLPVNKFERHPYTLKVGPILL